MCEAIFFKVEPNNHIRDDNERLKVCKYFNQGKCSFPASLCWDKHEKQSNNTSIVGDKAECHTCKNTFKTKNEMMLHRKKNHPENVKPCREQSDCTRKTCW